MWLQAVIILVKLVSTQSKKQKHKQFFGQNNHFTIETVYKTMITTIHKKLFPFHEFNSW